MNRRNTAYRSAVGIALGAAVMLVWLSLGVGIIALFATALAQAVVAAIALIAGLGLPWSPPGEILLLNGFFIALFAGSGWLFRRAAQGN